jgi:hypothetical protein
MGRNHMQLAPWCEKRSVLTLRVVCFRVHVWLCELFSFVQTLVTEMLLCKNNEHNTSQRRWWSGPYQRQQSSDPRFYFFCALR